MCGISGIVARDGSVDVGVLGRMTDLVRYRGPDGQGFVVGSAAGDARFYADSDAVGKHSGFPPMVGLGHRRLAILDLSPAGQQSMYYVPADKLARRTETILAGRDAKLAAAREARKAKRQQERIPA